VATFSHSASSVAADSRDHLSGSHQTIDLAGSQASEEQLEKYCGLFAEVSQEFAEFQAACLLVKT
jgi:hypothetical protein